MNVPQFLYRSNNKFCVSAFEFFKVSAFALIERWGEWIWTNCLSFICNIWVPRSSLSAASYEMTASTVVWLEGKTLVVRLCKQLRWFPWDPRISAGDSWVTHGVLWSSTWSSSCALLRNVALKINTHPVAHILDWAISPRRDPVIDSSEGQDSWISTEGLLRLIPWY